MRTSRLGVTLINLLTVSLAFALADTTALGQTLLDSAEHDPAGQYTSIKNVLGSIYRSTVQAGARKRSEAYELSDCGDSHWEYNQSQQPGTFSDLVNAAIEAVRLEADLRGLGYPAAAWHDAIAEFEKHRLVHIKGRAGKTLSDEEINRAQEEGVKDNLALFRRLEAALARYRAGHRSLPRVIVGELECGGLGGATVNLTTLPANGAVFYIPLFFYEVCKAQSIDPDDHDRCNQWQEAIAGQSQMMLGDYVYLVAWPDGIKRRGKFTIVNTGKDENITLSKPQ